MHKDNAIPIAHFVFQFITFMELRDIKQQFYTYRNGMLSDRLRSSGDCHSVIFGLNLPQIVDIAKNIGQDKALAEQLWANNTTRESRLLAPMIYPVADFTVETAKIWVESLENTEVVDVLCHRLMRKADYAEPLYKEYVEADSDILRYFALRLALNLIIIGRLTDMEALHIIAEKERQRNCKLTQAVVASILEEFE